VLWDAILQERNEKATWLELTLELGAQQHVPKGNKKAKSYRGKQTNKERATSTMLKPS